MTGPMRAGELGSAVATTELEGTGRVGDDLSVAEKIPLSLYIHLPWCAKKCPYCDFNSHVPRGPLDQSSYVDALLSDLDQELRGGGIGRPVSVFIGGGTPSLFDAAQIARLLEGIDNRVGLQAGVEITLEANPGSAEAARFADYRAAGVNRLSIGVQSLDDTHLAALGRIHTSAEARAAVGMARAAGFDHLNLDMMVGLPGQTHSQALADLRALIELAPEHLSWYQLTLEPNTLFHHDPPAGLPHDDDIADTMDAGQTLLADAGFAQYEVSAYARTGYRCSHNRNYWEFGDYLGLGAGAHGKMTRDGKRVVRTSKLRQPAAYLANVVTGAVSQRSAIATDELPLEFMLNAMRLNDGVPTERFVERTGLSLARIQAQLERAWELGLMVDREQRLQPSPRGHRYLNDLLALFQPG